MSRATARDKAILSAKPAVSSVSSLPSVGVAAEKVPTGGEMVVKCLEREGVNIVFGLSGGAAMPIFDALVDSKVKLILVRHEQGATHMADGFARSTGKVGVALVTSGPGATNTVTGLLTILEPLLICVLGVIVGGIVIAMYLPLFDLISQLSR